MTIAIFFIVLSFLMTPPGDDVEDNRTHGT
jgi:hypothetical protein